LYLIPIAILAWYANLGIAVVFAVISACEGFLADFWSGHVYSNPLTLYWNGLVWLGVFTLFVLLLHRLREALETERWLARFDHLTGILNRRAFQEILDAEIERSLRYHHPLTLAYLDCDNFKPVNDQYGHKVGDRALRVVAQTIQNNLRRSDRIARVGGDEFVILLTIIPFASAEQVLEKLRDEVSYAMNEQAWPITLSIGAVTYDRPELAAELMLKEADQLMYKSKKSGKNRIWHIHNKQCRHGASAVRPPE
jgi:diguanylate cyclase (GGDEF)-like protein